jgi:AcrR family transcriptional regulator
MKQENGSRDKILRTLVRVVSRDGIAEASTRRVAQEAGLSPSSIVHFFGNKSGLLSAGIDHVLNEDTRFHEDFLGTLSGLPLDQVIFLQIVETYVRKRARGDAQRFWLEVFVNHEEPKVWRDQAIAWHRMKRSFWQRLLQASGIDPGLAYFLTTSLVIEEIFAVSLGDDIEYQLLLRETIARMSSATFRQAPQAGTAGDWLRNLPQKFSFHDERPTDSAAERLLNAASKRILESGIHMTNDREVARLADTSQSMVVYHFGSSTDFVTRAIWRGLLREIPDLLDPMVQAENRVDDIGDWTTVMDGLVAPETADGQRGFYLGYTRLSCQAALLAGRIMELKSLVRHLRIIEGFATYRASRLYWPSTISFDASDSMAFGVWIKGAALLNRITDPGPEFRHSVLRDAAAFFGRRTPPCQLEQA